MNLNTIITIALSSLAGFSVGYVTFDNSKESQKEPQEESIELTVEDVPEVMYLTDSVTVIHHDTVEKVVVEKEVISEETIIVEEAEEEGLVEHRSLHKIIVDSKPGFVEFRSVDNVEVVYVGQLNGNKAHGFGYAIFDHKGFYEGNWKNNLRHGSGTYTWQNGDWYKGSYVNGKRSGYGSYYFESGEVYNGYWKNDLRHGQGKIENKKGKVIFEGEWKKDKPVK